MIIEPIEYASNFIKKLAAQHAPNAKAYAMFQMYDSDPVKYPSLRDRTVEMVPAVKAMAGEETVTIVTYKGRELYTQYQFDAVGAQFAQVFRFIFA